MSKAHYRIDEYTKAGETFFIVCYPGGLILSGKHKTREEADKWARGWFGIKEKPSGKSVQ